MREDKATRRCLNPLNTSYAVTFQPLNSPDGTEQEKQGNKSHISGDIWKVLGKGGEVTLGAKWKGAFKTGLLISIFNCRRPFSFSVQSLAMTKTQIKQPYSKLNWRQKRRQNKDWSQNQNQTYASVIQEKQGYSEKQQKLSWSWEGFKRTPRLFRSASNKSERKKVKLLCDHRAGATDYLDTILQLKFISSVFNNANDINPTAETGRITRMAQLEVHLSGGLSFHRWAWSDAN